MDTEFNQLASAMLALVFSAVMLVTELLFIERSARASPPAGLAVRATDDVFTRDGFMHASAVMRARTR